MSHQNSCVLPLRAPMIFIPPPPPNSSLFVFEETFLLLLLLISHLWFLSFEQTRQNLCHKSRGGGAHHQETSPQARTLRQSKTPFSSSLFGLLVCECQESMCKKRASHGKLACNVAASLLAFLPSTPSSLKRRDGSGERASQRVSEWPLRFIFMPD